MGDQTNEVTIKKRQRSSRNEHIQALVVRGRSSGAIQVVHNLQTNSMQSALCSYAGPIKELLSTRGSPEWFRSQGNAE